MKALIIGLTLFSTSLWACPNLTGSYTCKLGSNVFQEDITQTATGYTINNNGHETEYITDGQGREVPATDSYKDAIVKSSCRGEDFVVDFTATILYEGSKIAKEVSRTTYSINGDQLTILRKTKMKGLPMPTQQFICSKN